MSYECYGYEVMTVHWPQAVDEVRARYCRFLAGAAVYSIRTPFIVPTRSNTTPGHRQPPK